MANLLAGKLSVVTGGGGGIGRAICERFAAQGARVLVVDRDIKSAETTRDRLSLQKHAAFAGDISKSEDVQKLREFALKEFGASPNVVVNCAGITQDKTLLKMTEANFDAVIAVNLKGTYLIMQAFVQAAVEAQQPLSVINVSSIVGKVGNFGQVNYAASKSGVIGMTKSAAKELALKNIRVNAVLPGFVKTPMTDQMPPKVLQGICAGIPMGRMGEPEEIADAIVFLGSDLSRYVTGMALEVTGGLHM